MGAQSQNVILVDREGVIFTGRQTNMNQWKSGHTTEHKIENIRRSP
jgi:malic enzyme